jgi:hypothetical protein
MFFAVSVAYCWLIHASGVTPGIDDRESSQHQSSHQKSAPCSSIVWWRSRYAFSWSGSLQSNVWQVCPGPAEQPLGVSLPFAVAWAAGNCGSLLTMLGWMFSVLCRPCFCDQSKNAAGSGNLLLSISQPSQVAGDLKSVSVTRTSSGTPSARNFGRTVFS